MKKTKQKASDTTVSGVDLKDLERLLAFMAVHGLDELEYQRGGVHIRLRKQGPVGQSGAGQGQQAVLHSMPQGAGAAGATGAEKRPGKAAPAAEDLHTVKSPIVGTFYESPTPGAAAFVKVGDRVKAGQVLCIIEAMKLMNEIEADRSGEVVRCLVENGQPVEYGQGLFALRPAAGE